MPARVETVVPPTGLSRGGGVRLSLTAALLGATLALLAAWGGDRLLGLSLLGIVVAVILVYPVAGVTTMLVIAPTYLLLTPYVPPGLPVSFLLLALTVISLLVRRVFEPRPAPFAWSAMDVAAAFLLVNGLIYVPLSGNLKVGIYGYHENLRLFLLYFLVRLLGPGREAVRAMLWLVGLTAAAVAAYGIVQHFVGYDAVMVKYDLVEQLRGYSGLNKAGVQRAYSVTASPIQLGLLAMTLALGAIAILSRPAGGDLVWWLSPLLLVAGVGAAAFSYSRSAWLGIAAGLGIAVLALLRGPTRLFALGLPVVAGLAVAHWLPEVGEKLSGYAATIWSKDPTDSSFHYLALLEAARYFWSHKLGIGLGLASFASATHGTGAKVWSENAYFLIGIQTGIQGLLGLTAFLALAGGAGLRLSRGAADDAFEARLGSAVLLGMVGFAVSGLSLPVLLDAGSFGPLWVAAALAGNALERRRFSGGNRHPAAGGVSGSA